MLYMLSKPFNQMAKQLATLDTEYIEIVDDGDHALNANQIGRASCRERVCQYV
jgi:hypothetical protein